jgi:integrase
MRVKRPKPRKQRTLTLEQKVVLQRACHKTHSGKQTALMLEVLWCCGLRASEIVRVEVKDLDLTAGTLGVRGKGDTWGEVAIVLYLCALLEAWLKEERRFIAKPDTPTIFLNTRTGAPLTVDGFKALCHHISARANVPFSPHDARRGMACEMIQRGIPSRIVQLQGRWSNLAMLERYTNALTTADVRRALEAAR